ncbi:ATP-binding protein [Proteinivorax tanatarense]|uniref:ATP-binding protein n=1 Tax=Proteinivorax tanatarense TaxID=1260629 RepID=A0AAU7VM55_9FIRM
MTRKINIPNGAEAVKASYIEQAIREYQGNPFIEALPPILNKGEVVEKLAVYPHYDEGEKNLAPHLRLHIVQRIFQCLQPLPIHLDLESRISRVIRQGYLARNPSKPEFAESFHTGKKMIENLSLEISNNDKFRSTASGFTVIGVSGMGKTTAVNQVLSTIPQVIVHSEYRGNQFNMHQLSWLKLDCPFDGSVKGLCMEFFAKVDSLLGTTYFRKHGAKRNTVDSMLTVMSQVARNTALGMLVIDEIQHLKEAKSGGSSKMLNFFVTLINTIGLPVILIGTPKAMSILQSEFRQARRGSGQGDFVWDRLKKDMNWDLFIEAFWEFQWTRKKTPLSEEIKEVLYEESQGIIDVAVKLFAMAQVRAINSGKEHLDKKLIKQVAKENLKLIRPMIQALKSNNMSKVAKFEDISNLDFEEFLIEETPRVNSSEEKIKEILLKKKSAENEKNISAKEKAVLKLLDLDIPSKKAAALVSKVIEDESDDISVSNLVIKAIKVNSEEKSTRDNIKIKKLKKDDLRAIAKEKNNNSTYQSFKEKNIIKNSPDDFSERVFLDD